MDLSTALYSTTCIDRNDSAIDLTGDFGLETILEPSDQGLPFFSNVSFHANDFRQSLGLESSWGTLPPIPESLTGVYHDFDHDERARELTRSCATSVPLYPKSCAVPPPRIPYVTSWHDEAVSLAISWFYRQSALKKLDGSSQRTRDTVITRRAFRRELLALYTGVFGVGRGERALTFTAGTCASMRARAVKLGHQLSELEALAVYLRDNSNANGLCASLVETWTADTRNELYGLVSSPPNFARIERVAKSVQIDGGRLVRLFERPFNDSLVLDRVVALIAELNALDQPIPLIFDQIAQQAWWSVSNSLQEFLYGKSPLEHGSGIRSLTLNGSYQIRFSTALAEQLRRCNLSLLADSHLYSCWRSRDSFMEGRLKLLHAQVAEANRAREVRITLKNVASKQRIFQAKLARLAELQRQEQIRLESQCALNQKKRLLLEELKQDLRAEKSVPSPVLLGATLYESNLQLVAEERLELEREARCALEQLERSQTLVEWQIKRFSNHEAQSNRPPLQLDYSRPHLSTPSAVEYRKVAEYVYSPLLDRSVVAKTASVGDHCATSDADDFVSVESKEMSVNVDTSLVGIAVSSPLFEDLDSAAVDDSTSQAGSSPVRPELEGGSKLVPVSSLDGALGGKDGCSERISSRSKLIIRHERLSVAKQLRGLSEQVKDLKQSLDDPSLQPLTQPFSESTPFDWKVATLATNLERELRMLELIACHRLINDGCYLDFLSKFERYCLLADGDFCVRFEDAFFGRVEQFSGSLNWSSRWSVPFSTEVNQCLENVLPYTSKTAVDCVVPFFVGECDLETRIAELGSTDFLKVRFSSPEDLLDPIFKTTERYTDAIWQTFVRTLHTKSRRNSKRFQFDNYNNTVSLNSTLLQLSDVHRSQLWRANYKRVQVIAQRLSQLFSKSLNLDESLQSSELWRRHPPISVEEFLEDQKLLFCNLCNLLHQIVPPFEKL